MSENVIALVVIVILRVILKKPKRQLLITLIFAVFFAGGFLNIVGDETTSWLLGIAVALATHAAVISMRKQKSAQAAQQPVTTQPQYTAPPQKPVSTSTTPKPATTGTAPKPAAATKPIGKQVNDVLHTCVRCAHPLTQAQCTNCGYNHEKNMFYTLVPIRFE